MKIRKLVTLYNDALHDKEVSKEEVEAIDELLDDQRNWEMKSWNQGYLIGLLSAAASIGTYVLVGKGGTNKVKKED